MSSPDHETCLCIWCILDERSGLVYRLAARAYALDGTDDQKLAVLRALAFADYRLARELDVLSKYRTTLIDDSARSRTVCGISPRLLDDLLPGILDDVCKLLEGGFPRQLVADTRQPRTVRAEFGKEPLYVLTILAEDDSGRLRALVD